MVDGGEYAIFTDFRNWVQYSEMMLDEEISLEEKVYLSLNMYKEQPENISLAFPALTEFYLLGEKLKEIEVKEESEEEVLQPPLYNWAVDSPYIIGGFLEHYSIDLTTIEYLHWWKFKALFNNLIEFKLEERINYRAIETSKIKDIEERARITKIKNSLRLKQVISDEEIGGAFM